MKIKYPKFTLLLLTFVLAYALFSWRNVLPFQSELLAMGYVSAFLVGLLFSYGFTTSTAIVFMLMLAKDYNIFLFAAIAGFGALASDFALFSFIRFSFTDEIRMLSNEKPFRVLRHLIRDNLKGCVLFILAGFIIASPLPDEIGVCLLAGSKISPRAFSIFSYAFNTLGILVILAIGNSVYV